MRDARRKGQFIATAGMLWGVIAGLPALADDWPEFRGSGRDGIWKESGIIDAFPETGIEKLWRAPIGAGYSGPTVAGDRVYVMDRVGGAPGQQRGGQRAGETGDATGEEEAERILCFDRLTGKNLWTHSYLCRYYNVAYPLGPRASVTIEGGRAYALGTMGDFHCLDAASGEVIWKKDFRKEYAIDIPTWGITSSPLVEGGNVILQIGGADGACVAAFDKKTGEEVWRAFDDKASYVSPVMIEQAGKRVLVVWTGFRIAGMNAADGEVYWELSTRPNRMPINVPGPALDESGARMFLTTFYDGSRMLKLSRDEPAIEESWYRKGVSETKTDALHSMISPPYVRDGHVYGVDSYGELRCLDAETGDRLWESIGEAVPQGRWSTIFMVQQEERTWMFTELGVLIIAELTPRGYREISRAQLIEPTTPLGRRRQNVVWSHPAFAHKCVFARNDRELVCVSLAAE